MYDLATLPEICCDLYLNLDVARLVIRGRPDLQALGRRVGPAKVYTPAEAAEIASAYASYRAARPAARPVPAA